MINSYFFFKFKNLITAFKTFFIRMVGLVRLSRPTNLGENAQEVRFLILALVPTNEKGIFLP